MSTTTATVFGVEYTLATLRNRITYLKREDVRRGGSDDCRTELALAREALLTLAREAVIARAPARGAKPRREHYYGLVGKSVGTGKTHYLNGYGEAFCGTGALVYSLGREGTADCRTCQKAGDASLDGRVGGSPARR